MRARRAFRLFTAMLPAAMLCLSWLATPAAAQTKYILDCGNGLPCTEMVIWGYVDRSNNTTMPWVGSFHIPPNLCGAFIAFEPLCCDFVPRFAVLQPNGIIHKDRSVKIVPGNSTAHVVAINALQGGWYTLHLTMPKEGIFSIRFNLFAMNQPDTFCTSVPPS